MASSYIGFPMRIPYQVSKSKKGTFKKPAGTGKAAAKKPAAERRSLTSSLRRSLLLQMGMKRSEQMIKSSPCA